MNDAVVIEIAPDGHRVEWVTYIGAGRMIALLTDVGDDTLAEMARGIAADLESGSSFEVADHKFHPVRSPHL